MALDQLYAGSPYVGPFAGRQDQQIMRLPATGTATRNLALQSLLSQLQGPSYQSLYESSGADQLANEYRNQKFAQMQGLNSRGLVDSGAYGLSQLGLQKGYQQGMQSNVAGAQQSEQQRRLALLQALQTLAEQDVNSQHALTQAALAQGGAQNSNALLELQRNLDLAKGSFGLAAMLGGGIFGGVAGAGGVSAGLGGAGQGAMMGSNISGSLWGGGGMPTGTNAYQEQQQRTPPSGDRTNAYDAFGSKFSSPNTPGLNSQLYLSGLLSY